MKEPVLDLQVDAKGEFLTRENRFLGVVNILEPKMQEEVLVHIHDPGRLGEILYSKNSVLLQRVESESRKTDWTIIAGEVNGAWVFIHSGYHRQIAEWVLKNEKINLFSTIDEIIPEKRLGESRIDFLVLGDHQKAWVEVKGCTLARSERALFPDAPTARGRRHVKELTRARTHGDDAGMLILIFRGDAKCFAPNAETDPEFANIFLLAVKKGVHIFPVQFTFENDTLYYVGEIPLCKKQ